jgi:PAP2 superfamily
MMFFAMAVLGFVVIVATALVRRVKDIYPEVCLGVALPIFFILLAPFGIVTAWARPSTMDVALRHADLALGLDGFAMTRWLIACRLYEVALVAYAALPVMMAVAWSLERSAVLVRAILIGAVLCLPFYLLLPACGPAWAYPQFPAAESIGLAYIPWRPRNCIPSMHFTWALLLARNIKDRVWRWVFVVNAVLTAFVAVAVGEHYFVDMLAAIPFTMLVQKLASSGLLGEWPRFASARVSPIDTGETSQKETVPVASE